MESAVTTKQQIAQGWVEEAMSLLESDEDALHVQVRDEGWVADRLGIKLTTLRDKRWRARIGLPVVKIGKAVRYRESDVLALIERSVRKAG